MHPSGRPLTRDLDLNLLELFDIVYRTGNLTATGMRLGLSQPAVSYGLAKLRKIYGDALFVRMRHGVQPTPFAVDLAGPIAAAIEMVRGTIKKVEFVPAESRRTFRLAMSDIGERYFLPRLARRLDAEAPRVLIETLSPPLAELTDGLASGEINLPVDKDVRRVLYEAASGDGSDADQGRREARYLACGGGLFRPRIIACE
jgi:DNA-binding transcriptional LysR family regulator